jgi:hypothetical protein
VLCSGSRFCSRLAGETFLLWYFVVPIIHDMAHAYVPVTNHYHRAALSPVAALPALPIAVWEFSLGG